MMCLLVCKVCRFWVWWRVGGEVMYMRLIFGFVSSLFRFVKVCRVGVIGWSVLMVCGLLLKVVVSMRLGCLMNCVVVKWVKLLVLMIVIWMLLFMNVVWWWRDWEFLVSEFWYWRCWYIVVCGLFWKWGLRKRLYCVG